MDDKKFLEQLQTQANEYLNQGLSVEEVQTWVDRQKGLYTEKHGTRGTFD